VKRGIDRRKKRAIVMSDAEPTKVLVGVFSEGLPNVLYVPRGALAPAERVFDAAREQREALESKKKLAVLQQAKSRGRLKGALRACFGRSRSR
jgi:hypothetical protein